LARTRDEGLGEAPRRVDPAADPHRRLGLQLAGLLLLQNTRGAAARELDRAHRSVGQLRGQRAQSQQAAAVCALGRADRRRDGPRCDHLYVRRREDRLPAPLRSLALIAGGTFFGVAAYRRWAWLVDPPTWRRVADSGQRHTPPTQPAYPAMRAPTAMKARA